jgi:DNA-binding NtrC family response regulator
LNAIAKKEGTARKRLSREAMERLASHPLPGNVRQLEHLLLNACVMTEGEVIEPDDLALGDAPAANDRMAVQRGAAAVAAAEQVSSSEQPPAQSLEDYKDVEKQRILQALEEHGWNRARAANALGMPRRTFYRRLREYGVLT